MNNKKIGVAIGAVLAVVAAVVAIFCFMPKEEKEIVYKVKFDNDGVIETVEVTENNTVGRPADPTKEGYTFEGWYYNGAKFDFTTLITKDITLEARWTESSAKKWKVTFDTAGGEYIQSMNVEDGKKIDKIPTPTKDGYKFEGWYLNDEKFDFETTITKDILLVAHWTKNNTQSESVSVTKYTVTFNSNGGSTVPKQTIEKNKTVLRPNDPTKDGYVFMGWFNGDVEFDFKTKITKNITLTAKWKEIEKPAEPEKTKTYKVTYDTAGGSAISSVDVEEGKIVTKPTDPTREGYTFIGWYYNDVQYNFNTIVTSDITLVARWEKNHVITYKIEDIADSYVGQVRIFVLKDDVKVDGYVDIVTTNGKKVTKEISKDGYITNGAIIDKIENVKVK